MNLTKDSIPKLVRQLAIPASIGFFFNTMYNVVDTFYAGLINQDALAALAISFPLFFIILAIGSGIGTGLNALIANALGAKDTEQASRLAMKGISLSIIIGIILTSLGLQYTPFLFAFLGAEGAYLTYALDYMNMLLIGTVLFLLVQNANAILQSQGDTKSFRNVLITGFFLNIALNPILLFGLGPIPALGISGIALATVLIQVFSVLYLFWKVQKTKVWQKASFETLRPRWNVYYAILQQGFPASLNMLTVSIGIFIYTYFLAQFGSEAVAAYGVALRIEQIFLLPTIGLNIAAITLIAQNNGAGNFERVKETYYTCLKYGFVLSVIAFIGIMTIPHFWMRIFTDDAQTIIYGVSYLRFASVLTYAYVVMFLTVALYQGIKKPKFGLVLGTTRQIILPLLIIPFLLTLNLELYAVWIGIFCSVLLSALVTAYLGLRKVRLLVTN